MDRAYTIIYCSNIAMIKIIFSLLPGVLFLLPGTASPVVNLEMDYTVSAEAMKQCKYSISVLYPKEEEIEDTIFSILRNDFLQQCVKRPIL